VLATALGAVDAGVPVRVVGDACAGVSREAHERALLLLEAFRPQVALSSVGAERGALARA
jgi:nicotinamidase-related amidase